MQLITTDDHPRNALVRGVLDEQESGGR